mgnify:CR=1 FL=1
MNDFVKIWYLNHSNGEVYSFLHYNDDSGDGVRIRYNGKNCQEVIGGEHHSDGCYHLNTGRQLWYTLTSQGFEKQ